MELPQELTPERVRKMDEIECTRLCGLLREELVQQVSRTGGHLASNLGAVELTVALHRVFDTGRDRLVFDVGHQCYTHKLITGRGAEMDTLRKLGGLSGFPKPRESVHDAFVAGHASNSVSVALGMARARTLLQQDYHVVALIGDGALTGGLAYEGLSDAGDSGERLLVLLNDNGMSIVKNVGGIAKHLARQRLKPRYLRFKGRYRRLTAHTHLGRGLYRLTHGLKEMVRRSLLPSSFFEEMGFTYLGPVDGHDVGELTRTLEYAKQLPGPVVLHARTVKGRGYAPAEQTPDAFHGVSSFDVGTGKPLGGDKRDFSAVFGQSLCQLAQEEPRLCAITAAMLPGTSLTEFQERFPGRCFDVGIAEGHATAMAGGMAAQGLIPVFAVYSSFLQRAYDMLIHDIALMGLHAVFCVDRAGLVGSDGETHQGLFDVAFLRSVPGMSLYAPASFAELNTMLRHAVLQESGPVALRYPRGGEGRYQGDSGGLGAVCLQPGTQITLVSYGTLIEQALLAAERLAEQGISVELIKLNRLAPLDPGPVLDSLRKTRHLVVAEEAVASGCLGESLVTAAVKAGLAIEGLSLLNLGEGLIPQGTVEQLRALYGIDAGAMEKAAVEVLGHG